MLWVQIIENYSLSFLQILWFFTGTWNLNFLLCKPQQIGQFWKSFLVENYMTNKSDLNRKFSFNCCNVWGKCQKKRRLHAICPDLCTQIFCGDGVALLSSSLLLSVFAKCWHSKTLASVSPVLSVVFPFFSFHFLFFEK